MKEITVILCCTWKFALTFPVAIFAMKFSFWRTILFTNIGGLLGLLVSIYLSKLVLYLWECYFAQKFRRKNYRKQKFNKRKRLLVMIKSKYGLPGIVVLSPVILSIPVGAFLTTKYYGTRPDKIFWLLIGQVGWSFVYTYFYTYIQVSV